MDEIQKKNKELVERFPFLAFKEYDFDTDSYYLPDDYDYSTTWLDYIPEGWVKAFGEQMCEELKEALEEYNYVDDYIIVQAKEKYNQLRIYDNGIPKGCRAWDVIDKYSNIAERTCVKCGKPATKVSMGWISSWCDDCAKEVGGVMTDIDEFYDENWDEDPDKK